MKATPAMPEHEAGSLGPGHALAEHQGGEDGGDDRIGAEDENRQAGRYITQGDITDAEIDCLVGNAQQREQENVAAAERPAHAA